MAGYEALIDLANNRSMTRTRPTKIVTSYMRLSRAYEFSSSVFYEGMENLSARSEDERTQWTNLKLYIGHVH